MIRLQRDRAAIPQKYRGAGLTKLLVQLLSSYYDNAGSVPFNRQKSLQVWKQAKESLKAESFGKCAYCETLTGVNQYGDVEHFRPKDLYWWLAYSYDNYTYSCVLCNERFKVANFPMAGSRVEPPVKLPKTKPAVEALPAKAAALCPDPANDNDANLRTYFKSERAHLPHPYLDDPEQLFAWKVDDVNSEVTVVPRTKKVAARRAVAAAVQFFGLNREDLSRSRYATYSTIRALCLILQETDQQVIRDHALPQLQAAVSPKSPFAGMARHFLREWHVLQ